MAQKLRFVTLFVLFLMIGCSGTGISPSPLPMDAVSLIRWELWVGKMGCVSGCGSEPVPTAPTITGGANETVDFISEQSKMYGIKIYVTIPIGEGLSTTLTVDNKVRGMGNRTHTRSMASGNYNSGIYFGDMFTVKIKNGVYPYTITVIDTVAGAPPVVKTTVINFVVNDGLD
jgi:hypothetical protein